MTTTTFPTTHVAEPTSGRLTRREFLTYAWGAALGVLTVGVGASTYRFLMPRFQAGEFGGEFFVDGAALPTVDAPPKRNADGKFWLVQTEAGPKALYTVCTHLGCLYDWNASENRFKCPCHNSQFSREGDLLQGPATRALDQFPVEPTEAGAYVIDTGTRIRGVEA